MNQKKLLKRHEVSQNDKWNITDLYENDTLWENDFAKAQEDFAALAAFAGKLTDAKNLFACLKQCDTTGKLLDRVYVYAFMRFHEDSQNSFYQGLSNRAETLLIQYSSVTAFVVPEILAIPQESLDNWRKECPKDFALYHHFLENILRQKDHTLPKNEEALLAQAGELGLAPHNIFAMINDADMKFADVTDSKGNTFPLTKGRYTLFLESQDRALRCSAFTNLYQAYISQKNTLAATFSASVKSDVFFATARKYNSALEMALSDDNIPLSVYDTLIETVHKGLPLLHRYIALRKKLLGVDQLHLYDLYVPLVAEADKHIPYEEAKETVKKALAVMGEEYTKALETGLEGGWIDVYENEGKRGGAYSWGTYTCHPFVLLNHADNINSMFTLAHEMGHALHSYFTWEKQPYIYGGHKIFVAEVASTCNEALLMEYLLKNTTDKTIRRYLLNYYLEQFRGTFFRQTMFAEFEKITHAMAEKGESLTCEALSKVYRDLNRTYFGEDIVLDSEIDMEWSRIPHFYNAFYVYQYATGYSAAIALSEKIVQEGQPAIQAYLDFLRKGTSEYSIDLLKGAGVDMTTKAPLEKALAVFESLLTEMEQL